MLKGKHILLGITGSIAAYKAAYLVRALVKQGAEVKIIMTEMAKQFISPLTMATLSKNPILVDFYNPENGDWNSHISLGLWADAYLIAPASANTIAKMANGIADNLLLTTYLSSRCPVIVAPAMDVDMFLHSSTQKNISTLSDSGVMIIEPQSGELASGLDGKGRMEEPDIIVHKLIKSFYKKSPLEGKNILITAGPTREIIDPVRYISNFSTGKMGYSLAEEFAYRGANVTLISGPTDLNIKNSGVSIVNVVSAEQMYNESLSRYDSNVDVVVLCAAVSDFTPLSASDLKLKRGKDDLHLNLKPTKDIAEAIGARKFDSSILIGFALETNDEKQNAFNKLTKKNLDAIVLNSLRDTGAGFATDTNKISIISRNGACTDYSIKTKLEVASDIVDFIEQIGKC